MKFPWIVNTSKKPDAMLTFAVLAFVVVLAKFMLAGLTLTIAAHTIAFGELDATLVAALLTPTLGSYVLRRGTDRKYLFGVKSEDVVKDE